MTSRADMRKWLLVITPIRLAIDAVKAAQEIGNAELTTSQLPVFYKLMIGNPSGGGAHRPRQPFRTTQFQWFRQRMADQVIVLLCD